MIWKFRPNILFKIDQRSCSWFEIPRESLKKSYQLLNYKIKIYWNRIKCVVAYLRAYFAFFPVLVRFSIGIDLIREYQYAVEWQRLWFLFDIASTEEENFTHDGYKEDYSQRETIRKEKLFIKINRLRIRSSRQWLKSK